MILSTSMYSQFRCPTLMYFLEVKNDHFFEKRQIAIFGVDFYKLIYLHRNQNFYIIHRNESDLKNWRKLDIKNGNLR